MNRAKILTTLLGIWILGYTSISCLQACFFLNGSKTAIAIISALLLALFQIVLYLLPFGILFHLLYRRLYKNKASDGKKTKVSTLRIWTYIALVCALVLVINAVCNLFHTHFSVFACTTLFLYLVLFGLLAGLLYTLKRNMENSQETKTK